MNGNLDNVEINFHNVDELEAALLRMINKHFANRPDQLDATTGRALLALIPGFCNFIRNEIERNEDKGPATACFASIRSFGFLAGLMALGSTHQNDNGESAQAIIEPCVQLFEHDMQKLVDTVVSDGRHSETRH